MNMRMVNIELTKSMLILPVEVEKISFELLTTKFYEYFISTTINLLIIDVVVEGSHSFAILLLRKKLLKKLTYISF